MRVDQHPALHAIASLSVFASSYAATVLLVAYLLRMAGLLALGQWAWLTGGVVATLLTISVCEGGRWRIGLQAPARIAVRELLLGAALAAVLVLAADGLVLATTALRHARGSGFSWLELIAVYAPAAIHEELVFRGYPLQKLRTLSRPVAIGVTSLVFAAMHGANNGLTAVAFANLLLAALVPHRPSPGLESPLWPHPRLRREWLHTGTERVDHARQGRPASDGRDFRDRREHLDCSRRGGRHRPFVVECTPHETESRGASMKDIVIVDGARTPMAEYNGQFSDISAIDLAAIAAKEALRRSGTAPEDVQHVIVGNALQTSGDAIYGARHVGLKAGVPKEVPALTVNRLCGSGIQSVINAAEQIELDEATTVLAGGMENMSQAPFVVRGARKGLRLGQAPMEDSLMVALLDSYAGLYMAQTSDNLARKYNISREEQDQYALRSQERAAGAKERLREEIIPVPVGRKGELFSDDDHGRPETTPEGLAKLKPAFAKDGFVTAGNASGIVDGAAMLVVTTAANARDKKPLGRIVSWGVSGCDPEIMGIGPVPATKIALKKARLSLDDIDLIEINEAFAGQILAVVKELGVDQEKLNVNGGAIALGHPLAASGTRLLLTVLYELRRRQKRYGLATACIGGGQGIAMIVERV